MDQLFDSPRIADLILAVLLVESVLLTWRFSRTGREPGPRTFVPFLVAGACLVLALRGALTDAAWPWMAAALAGAGMAHVVDLTMRGRS